MLRTIVGILLITGGGLSYGQTAYRVSTIAGSSFAGDGRDAMSAILQQAEGIAIAPDGTMYIADAGDHRVRIVSPKGEINTLAGDGTAGFEGDNGPAGKARLNSPYGLALDRQGNLYIADLGNARIRMVTPDKQIRTVAGGGEIAASESSEGSPATSLKFKTPRNVLADPGGGFYFSDFDAHRVYFVDIRGILTIFAGTGNPGYGADNVPAIRSALRNPAGLAIEPQGGVVIVESGSQRLRRVARGTVTAYLADALRNYPLYSPTGVAFDGGGNMYLADARATGALKRTPQGTITALAVSGRAVAADPRGGAAYAWNNAVYRVDAANKVTLAAGTGAGVGEIIGDGSSAETARLLAPAGVAYDREGNLYIADERAHRVRRVTPAGLITTVAGTGKAAYSGDGGRADKASLNTPRGLAFDSNGFLYVADSGNNAVRIISPSGAIATVAGNAFAGFRGDGGPATAAQLSSPSAVAVAPNSGEVYIADTGNHRIRRITQAGLIATAAGTGVAGMAFEGSAAVFAQLNEPRGVAVDAVGNVYIADSGNNRIRRIDITGLLTTIGDGSFTAPRGVAAALDGSVYVADTGKNRICQIYDNQVVHVAGGENGGFGGDGEYAKTAQFQSPAGLTFDAQGNLAVADMGNGRIRQLRPELLQISVFEEGPRILNAASNADGPVAPGMLATLRGEGFGPAEAASAPSGPNGWPKLLGDVDVYVDGEAAPLLYVSARQINLQIPASVNGKTQVTIEVYHQKASRARTTARVAAAAPGVFPQLVQEDGTINAATNPAARGSVVLLFATGLGTAPLSTLDIKVGTLPAQVLWAGPAPGLPGITQINLRLPSGFFSPGGMPVTLKAGGATAPGGLSVYLQ